MSRTNCLIWVFMFNRSAKTAFTQNIIYLMLQCLAAFVLGSYLTLAVVLKIYHGPQVMFLEPFTTMIPTKGSVLMDTIKRVGKVRVRWPPASLLDVLVCTQSQGLWTLRYFSLLTAAPVNIAWVCARWKMSPGSGERATTEPHNRFIDCTGISYLTRWNESFIQCS